MQRHLRVSRPREVGPGPFLSRPLCPFHLMFFYVLQHAARTGRRAGSNNPNGNTPAAESGTEGGWLGRRQWRWPHRQSEKIFFPRDAWLTISLSNSFWETVTTLPPGKSMSPAPHPPSHEGYIPSHRDVFPQHRQHSDWLSQFFLSKHSGFVGRQFF